MHPPSPPWILLKFRVPNKLVLINLNIHIFITSLSISKEATPKALSNPVSQKVTLNVQHFQPTLLATILPGNSAVVLPSFS